MEEADFGEGLEEEVQEDVLDPNNPDDAFAILERDYNRVYTELEEDPNLAQYAEEFNKIFEALFKTRNQAVDLQQNKEELLDLAKRNEERIENSKKVMSSDAQTIRILKDEVEKSHMLIDNAHAREQAAQEIIDNLRRQIGVLNAEIDFKNKMAEAELEEDPKVIKHREGLEREKARLVSEVTKLTERLNNAVAYQDELEKRTSLADLKLNEMNTQLEETNAEVERFKRQKDKLETELEFVNAEVVDHKAEIATLNESIQSNEKMISKYELQIKEQLQAAMKCYKEMEGWNIKLKKLQDENDTINYQNSLLKKELGQTLNELKFKDDERAKTVIDLRHAQKQKEQAENNTKKAEHNNFAIEQDRNKLRGVLHDMEREITMTKKQADTDKRAIEQMAREKDILNKNILRQQAVTRDHIKVLKVQEQTRRKLEIEIDCHVIERRKHVKQISYLEKERDRLLEEELDLTKKIEDIMDEIKLKKNLIFDLKKSLVENENRLRIQQNLFDAVRADRNALQKTLQESTAENHELKKKFKTINYQTEQLKEDIASKEQLLIKEETILRKVNKEKENLKVEVNVCHDQIRSLKDDIAARKTEEKRLHSVIVNNDRHLREQAKTITQLMNERDVLGAQLVRRNDEISLLYEKIKILQTTLHRGEAQYDQRLQDIKLLKVEIRRLRQEKNLLTKSINNMINLKQEVFHLERDLTRERLKTKALEDELQNPMNIHRWRKLEGSDPEIFELLQKTTLLQKRLLREATKNIEMERQLKETEKLYMNLRQVVSKQPGPEVQKRLVKTQKALVQYTSKMKCLVSELNLTENQLSEHKIAFEKSQGELAEAKKTLLNEKKQHTKDLEILKTLTAKLVSEERSHSQIRFTGGGFRMSDRSVNR